MVACRGSSEDREPGERRANNEVQEDYGKGLKPSTLYHEIKKVRFEGLNLWHLYRRGQA